MNDRSANECAHDRAPLGVGVHDVRRDAGRGRALLDLDLAPPGVERLLLRGDLQHEGLAAGVDLVHAGAGQAGGDARDGRRRAAERFGQTVGEPRKRPQSLSPMFEVTAVETRPCRRSHRLFP
jgi:hypothetical protein